MTITEDTLLKQIEEVEEERKGARVRITQLKRELLNAETDLISANLRQEGLKESLRVHRASIVDHSLTDREKDIERFRLAHPGLMKKI